MRRRIFTFLSSLSLLLCVAVTVLWVRSYRCGDFGELIGLLDARSTGTASTSRTVGIFSSHGSLGFGSVRGTHPTADPVFRRDPNGRRLVWNSVYCWTRYPFMSLPRPTQWNERGFAAQDSSWSSSYSLGTFTTWSCGVAAPHWLLLSVAALLPAKWLTELWRKVRHVRPGHCAACNYDLRATTERCPECGAAVKDVAERSD